MVWLEEVHALPGCRRQENNASCFKILVSKYFSSDINTKVLGNLLFGKNYTCLEFGPDLKEFLGT